jgi:hypothetical protein
LGKQKERVGPPQAAVLMEAAPLVGARLIGGVVEGRF